MPYRWTLTDLIAPYVAPVTLTSDPIGWDDGVYSIKRSEIYKGAFHEYTTSLKFYCNGGGKEFIDEVYAQDDIDGRISVLVEYDCDGSGVYDELFSGIIDLSSYSTDGEYTTVKIEKSDLLTKLFSRDDISVDLESTVSIGGSTITAPTPTTLAMHSQNLFLKSAMSGDVPFTASVDNGVTDTFTYRGLITSSLTTTRQEAQSFTGWSDYNDFGNPGKTRSDSELSPIFEAIDVNVDYPDTYTYRVNIKGLFHDIVVGSQSRINSAHSLVLVYGESLAAGTPITLYTTSGYSTSLQEYTESFDTGDVSGTITLNYGDGVWLYWFESEVITTGPYNDSLIYQWDYTNADFSIEINSVTAATTAKTMLVHEAFNQVVDAIADSDGNFYSGFYGRTDSQKVTYASDGCGSPIAITNGLNIRKIDKPIHNSFRQLFNTFDCLHNIGMGVVDGKIMVEMLEYWFDTTTKLITLPKVNKYITKNDNRRYFNKIDIGYQKWESEYLGGLDEVCTKHEYSTEVSSVKNQLSKLSEFLASGYTIEFTRRKWNDQITEDWRYDNDNFLIASSKCLKITGSAFVGFTNANTIDLLNISVASLFSIGDSITLSGTTNNNGTFTIVTVADIGSYTHITTVEATVAEVAHNVTVCNNTSPIWNSELYSDSFSYGSGMTSLSTAYNLRLTPARMLLAHMNTITAGLQTIKGQIKFIKGDGNTDLSVAKDIIPYTFQCQEDYESQVLSESQSFDWNDSRIRNITPIWLPETYSFEYPLTYTEFKTIKANPYGYVEFYKFSDDVKSGFILSMEYKMKTGMTTFELLKRFQ